MHDLDIRPLTNNFGGEILNVELKPDMSNAEFAAIRQAFFDYGVIFFRNQNLTPDEHLAFARRWGKININRFFTPVEGYPEIAEVRKEKNQTINIGGGWHTDHSYDQEPAMGSLLYARQVPSSGGDTLFADMARAYETLSDGLKKTLLTMRAVHSSRHVFGQASLYKENDDLQTRIGNAEAATQDAIHPVIITHPESKRKVLYVNPGFTRHFEGWTMEESKPLLDYLYQHAARPEHTCRFHWQEGSVALWDNRATWHYALNDYHGQFRLMHRITIEGCALDAAL